MKREAYKWKVPVMAFVVNIIVILLMFLPLVLFIGAYLGLEEGLMENASLVDVVADSLLAAAKGGNILILTVEVYLIRLLVIQVVGTLFVTLWNIIWNCCNRKDKKWILAVSLVPGFVISIILVVEMVLLFLDFSILPVLAFAVPGMILLISQVWQWRLFLKKEELPQPQANDEYDYD